MEFKKLFADEAWYKGLKTKEQTFTGVVRKVERGGELGFGRFNPFRLQMKKDSREIYVGAEGKLLESYVGKHVELVGRPVDMEVEGQEHREIWPARIRIAPK